MTHQGRRATKAGAVPATGYWFINGDIGDSELDSLGALLIALLIGFALWAIIVVQNTIDDADALESRHPPVAEASALDLKANLPVVPLIDCDDTMTVSGLCS